MKRIIATILLTALLPLLPIAAYGKDKSRENSITGYTEIMPGYPGGDSAIYAFIKERLIYPHVALLQNIEGRVITRFVVDSTGRVRDASVRRGIHPACDSLALKIVRSMPRWTPGSRNGKPIAIHYTLPIAFRIPKYKGEDIYLTCDTMPRFAGGEAAMHTYISKNLKYPIHGCCEFGVQGRVTVRFVVTSTGRIEMAEVLRGISPTLDAEAVRLIRAMPDWIPARQNGLAVNCYYILPVVFRIH